MATTPDEDALLRWFRLLDLQHPLVALLWRRALRQWAERQDAP